MIEILWHGRGGQGAFTAAKLLGAAYSHKSSNCFALAFPSFGPERRGAPIRAFTKLDSKPIKNRSEVTLADYIIFLDDTLFSQKDFNDLKPNGRIIINSKNTFDDKRIISIDGNQIASDILKLPICNTVMLGAIVAIFAGITVEDITFAIKKYMHEKLQKKNIDVVISAYQRMNQEV